MTVKEYASQTDVIVSLLELNAQVATYGCNIKKACKNRQGSTTVTTNATSTIPNTDTLLYQSQNEIRNTDTLLYQSQNEIRAFVEGLDQGWLQTLCIKCWWCVSRGVVIGTTAIWRLPSTSSTRQSPEWCKCLLCRPMPSPVENVRCRKRPCVTTY